MKPETLATGPQIYVTRAATLAYQELSGEQFETARRELTERLLRAVRTLTSHPAYLSVEPDMACPRLLAWIIDDSELRIVTRIAAADAPLRNPTPEVHNGRPAHRRNTPTT